MIRLSLFTIGSHVCIARHLESLLVSKCKRRISWVVQWSSPRCCKMRSTKQISWVLSFELSLDGFNCHQSDVFIQRFVRLCQLNSVFSFFLRRIQVLIILFQRLIYVLMFMNVGLCLPWCIG